MVTLAFGTIIQILINEMTFLTEGPIGIKVAKPIFFGHKLTEVEYFYLVAVLMVLALVVVHRILKSHLGRAFEALRDSPVACDCMGVSVYHYKVYAFVISAGLAGLAGSLYTYSEEYISPNTYNFELTIMFLLAVIMGGRKTRSGALIGAAIVVMLPSLLSDIELFRKIATVLAVAVCSMAAYNFAKKIKTVRELAVPVVATVAMAAFSFQLENITDWRLTIFGLMTLFVVYYLQDGVVGFARDLFARFIRPAARASAKPPAVKVRAWSAPLTAAAAGSGPLLEAQQVLMQFGGLKALNQVDLRIARGSIHGLIGPNGSGKSTMMNVLTGIYQPTAGQVGFQRQCGDGPDAIEHCLVRHRTNLSERPALWRDDRHRQRAGGPASHLQKQHAGCDAAHPPLPAGRCGSARAGGELAGLRRFDRLERRTGAQSAVWQATHAGDRARPGLEPQPVAAG